MPGTPHPLTDVRKLAAWKPSIISFMLGAAVDVTDHEIMGIYGIHRFRIIGDWQHSGAAFFCLANRSCGKP